MDEAFLDRPTKHTILRNYPMRTCSVGTDPGDLHLPKLHTGEDSNSIWTTDDQ